jgi:diaminohydroxyphosphoribosylaminopyrimidine deaminase/5-amino-6-(5-phosphoribosylamino)uracil reductase
MVAGNTLRTDHPRLDVRDIPGFKRTLRRYVATESMTTDEVRAFFPEGAAAEAVRIDPAGEWLDCMGREKITNLLVEGGGELAALLVKNRQVDEIEFHIAPKLLCGKGSRPVTGGDDPESLSEAVGLQNVTVEMLEDGTLVYRGIPSWGKNFAAVKL